MPWQSSAQFADFVWRYVDVINQSVLLLQKVNCFQRSNETSDDMKCAIRCDYDNISR